MDASTLDVTETRYKPWGEVRYTTANKTLPTRYTFTGQYSYVSDDATDLGAAGFGLMFYNARWYDPALGRFAQADTVVPAGVQGLDRYAYVSNNPIVYTDPSGHAQYRSDYQQQIHNNKMEEYNPKPKFVRPSRGVCEEFDAYGNCMLSIEFLMVYDPEQAIKEIIKIFEIDIPALPASFDEFSEIEIVYTGDSYYDGLSRIEDGKYVIRLGLSAFRGSIGWLASTIVHELCHAQQRLGPTCQTYRTGGYHPIYRTSEGQRKYGLPGEGGRMNEIEAYDLELSKAEFFGLTVNEIAELVKRRAEQYDRLLFYENRVLVNHHYYVCVPGTCNEWQVATPTP